LLLSRKTQFTLQHKGVISSTEILSIARADNRHQGFTAVFIFSLWLGLATAPNKAKSRLGRVSANLKPNPRFCQLQGTSLPHNNTHLPAVLTGHPTPPSPLGDGDGEQLRSWSEASLLVVFALCVSQGIQVRRRVFKASSSPGPASKGQCADEQLVDIAHPGPVHADDTRVLGLYTLAVDSAVFGRPFARVELVAGSEPGVIIVLIFDQFWEGADKICEEESDTKDADETAVGIIFGG
jgi:hypothetical protein